MATRQAPKQKQEEQVPTITMPLLWAQEIADYLSTQPYREVKRLLDYMGAAAEQSQQGLPPGLNNGPEE